MNASQTKLVSYRVLRKSLPVVVLIGVLSSRLHAAPPFHGTIFIDPDIITSSDPTTFKSVTPAGQANRRMFDRRGEKWTEENAYLFTARFDRGREIEIQVNPEFGSIQAAEVEAEKYTKVIGRLPTSLRANVETVWIHRGMKLFGGGNKNLLIHTEQADQYTADGILEEALVHEASHTSLDPTHAVAATWIKAQQADREFISKYALENPKREDIAESYLPYLAIRYRKDRISDELAQKITRAMPHRIEYFDALSLDLYPLVEARTSKAAKPSADAEKAAESPQR